MSEPWTTRRRVRRPAPVALLSSWGLRALKVRRAPGNLARQRTELWSS